MVTVREVIVESLQKIGNSAIGEHDRTSAVEQHKDQRASAAQFPMKHSSLGPQVADDDMEPVGC